MHGSTAQTVQSEFPKTSGTDGVSTELQKIENGAFPTPVVIRDYTASKNPSRPHLTAVSTPEVVRDYSSNNVVLVEHTQKPSDKIQNNAAPTIPIYNLKDGSKSTTDLTIIRDTYDDSQTTAPVKGSGNLNQNAFAGLPIIQINGGKIDSSFTTKSPSSLSSATPGTATVPDDLQIARDKMETSKIQQNTPPPDLVVIRDVIEDESQDPDRVIPTPGTTRSSDIKMDEKTIAPGSNLVLLLPKDDFKFFG